MEFVYLLIFVFLILPLILSITAIVKASAAKNEVAELKSQLAKITSRTEQPPVRPATPPPISPAPPPIVEKPKPASQVPASSPAPAVMADVSVPVPVPAKSTAMTEVVFGGKVASFAGIGLLLIGIAFLIGYAIKHAWLGPEARIVLGLICGTVLVGLGHLAEVRGQGRLSLLARILTGGGSAVFYFCVFAAYGIYKLIGMQTAGIGLTACAAAALGLAMAYRSQAVGVIGVIGAFLMPTLIATETPSILFLLTYIAVINFPVIALGIYRNWQLLYNTAFGFTVFYAGALLVNIQYEDGWKLLLFSLVYFFQFASLGLIKLNTERDGTGRAIDIIRLLLNSLGLLGAIYVLMDIMKLDQWTGAAMVAMAVVHIGLVRIGWRWRPSYTHDLLALLIGALTFASLALPIQLDGAWVSVGWSIEGVILCWFALRARIPLLQFAALLLGAIGLLKSLLFDMQFYETAATLFLNARFVSGLLAAVLLGVQGAIHRRYAEGEVDETSDLWTILPPMAVLGVLAVFGADIFWTLGTDRVEAWLLSSLVLLVVAVVCAMMTDRVPMLSQLTRGLLFLVPAKLLLDVLILSDLSGWTSGRLFLNGYFAALAAMSIFMIVVPPVLIRRSTSLASGTGVGFATTLNLTALISGILIVTAEIYRMEGSWNQTIVTIWLAACAITLVAIGLIRRYRPHRYAGLWIFGAATLKVLVVDLEALDGLERIAAFMGVGVLLLILSFVYQRAAARLAGEEEAQS